MTLADSRWRRSWRCLDYISEWTGPVGETGQGIGMPRFKVRGPAVFGSILADQCPAFRMHRRIIGPGFLTGFEFGCATRRGEGRLPSFPGVY